MAQQHVVVDVAAVRAVADQLDAAADSLDGVVLRLGRLSFSRVAAGRAFGADGDAVRRALDRWPGELARWSRASAEIAAALRVGTQRYAEAEHRAADGLG